MTIDDAIALFDKSATRTKPNSQTEAWAIIREALLCHKWQPMETAQKDGTTIMGFRRYGENTHQFEIFTMWWDGCGWDAEFNTCYAAPSHWMPLPEPPNGLVEA